MINTQSGWLYSARQPLCPCGPVNKEIAWSEGLMSGSGDPQASCETKGKNEKGEKK